MIRNASLRRYLVPLAIAVALVAGLWIGRAGADQPHMQSALDHLRSAKVELEAAEADKGGHRVKALALVQDAINQVEMGISYDRHH